MAAPCKDTILLTGATGFLGSNILRALLADGYNVVVLKRSFSDVCRIADCLPYVKYYDMDKVSHSSIFQENDITVVIHCATNYGRKDRCPRKVVDANLILPLDLLYEGQQHNLKIFINTDTILDKRINYYSLSKNQFVDWLRMFSPQIKGITVALEHFYGPGDDETKFVTNTIAALLSGVPELRFTKGEQKRDFVYVSDVVSAFMSIVRNMHSLPAGYSRFEVGSGKNIPIRAFVEKLRDIIGNKNTIFKFGAISYRENEVMESHVDVSGITALGWRPEVGLEKGLAITIDQERKLRS